MIKLPEKIRRPLDKLVKNLKTRETISSISLFGSWSRGDAESSSDVDLLTIDNQDFGYEYVERLEQNGILIDLNYIPQKWIIGPVPPEIDQKIYEAYVLYDRDWTFTNTKEHVMNSYYNPERISIRAESHLVDADIYLSRAASAYARGDCESTQIFATMAAQTMLKTIMEVSKLPFTNSHFIETLEKATHQLNMTSLFKDYLSVAKLDNMNPGLIEEKLSSFRAVWDEISSFAKMNPQLVGSMHFKIKTKLGYYTTPAFLQGMILRSHALLNEGAFQETAHYTLNPLLDMLENYAWLKAAEQNIRLDYTTLFRSLKGLKQKPSTIYRNAAKALNLENMDKDEAKRALTMAKQIVLKLREQRKMFFDQMQKETY